LEATEKWILGTFIKRKGGIKNCIGFALLRSTSIPVSQEEPYPCENSGGGGGGGNRNNTKNGKEWESGRGKRKNQKTKLTYDNCSPLRKNFPYDKRKIV